MSMDIVKNIDILTELNGWTLCYDVIYATATTTSDLSSCAQGDDYYVFVGAKKNSSSTNVYIGAFAPNSVLTITTSSTSIAYKPTLNGYNVYWYNYPSNSFGFAPNSTINLNSADIVNRYGNQDNRLSWHLTTGGGWRAGKYTELNSDATWHKIIYYKYCPPTSDPTTYPTTYPTKYPTSNPTINPTIEPTIYPTIYPSVNPSSHPTIYPTTTPTFPSLAPSISPTLMPSLSPVLFLNIYVSPSLHILYCFLCIKTR